MSRVTTLGIGGLASEFLVVKSTNQLIQSVKQASRLNKKFLVIGNGSNLLVSDKGINALVIKNEVSGITTSEVGLLVPSVVEGDSSEVYVKSGTLLQDLVDYTIQHGLSGLQNLTGIPGTVGGAIFGNAGAYGQTISDYITRVVILSPERSRTSISLSTTLSVNRMGRRGKNIITLSKKECLFNYRDSIFKKSRATVLEATFILEKKDSKKLKKEACEILAKRLSRYPKDLKCPGSFFKNIPSENLSKKVLSKIPKAKIPFGKVNAGYLLESVGAKGQKLGDIEISKQHANLFINRGRGTAVDFHSLAKKYAKKVKNKFGITLEPEVRLINLPPIYLPLSNKSLYTPM